MDTSHNTKRKRQETSVQEEKGTKNSVEEFRSSSNGSDRKDKRQKSLEEGEASVVHGQVPIKVEDSDAPKVQVPSLPTDITALLQNLAQSKQALQKQLEEQKKETQQAMMLKKAVKQQKLHQVVKDVKKEPSTPAREPATPSREFKEPERVKDMRDRNSKDRDSRSSREKGRDREGRESRDRDSRDSRARDKDRESRRESRSKDREGKERSKDSKDRRESRESSRSRKEEEEDKVKKISAIQERIKEGMSKVPKLAEKKPGATDHFVPPPLLLDSKGRELDTNGNVISTKGMNIVTTLKANRKYRVKQKMLDLAVPLTVEKENKRSMFYDASLNVPKPERQRRSLNFLEAGAIVKKANKLRAKTVKEDESKDGLPQAQEEKKEEVAAPKKKKKLEEIPEVEWWDTYLLPDGVYTSDLERLNLSDVTIYVEHPVPIRPPGEKDDVPMPMFLTKKEQKRLRKKNRMERDKERQERVLLGLDEPPPPKVKISNLMRVLGAEATADPTQIEQEVRRQMAQRVANHEARNQERKLTKEERKEKKRQKFANDVKSETHVALFKVKDLSDPRHKFKVDINAREMQLTGCAILFKDVNLIVVEGGSKAIRKFKKLMTKRIDWSEDLPVQEGKEGEKAPEAPMDVGAKRNNACFLVWQGTILKPNFQQFRFETMTNEDHIRKYLNHRWSEHYWDMVCNFQEPKSLDY